jgi:hypothetical protein
MGRRELAESLGIPLPLCKRLYRKAYYACRRCGNPTKLRYGGRGVEFRFSSLEECVKYLITLPGHRDRSLVLDRTDNDGHYEPGNLRFITNTMNLKNTTPNPLRRSDSAYSKTEKELKDARIDVVLALRMRAMHSAGASVEDVAVHFMVALPVAKFVLQQRKSRSRTAVLKDAHRKLKAAGVTPADLWGLISHL